MKASYSGTYTEQVMYRIGYLTSKERQDAGKYGNKCSNCGSLISAPAGFKRVRCSDHDLATTINATCNKWREK